LNIIFMGTPDFAVPSLKLLAANNNILAVFSQPARPNGRGMKTIDSAIENEAKKLNLKTITPYTLKDDKIFLEYKKLNPDIVIVVAYGLILPERFLKVPKFGCINGHASLLPRWRGAAPIQRAIEAGDKKTGSCIMIMEKGMDTGPIILSKKINIDDNDTSKLLHDKLSQLTAEMLIKTIENYKNGKISIVKQSHKGITYANKINKNESKVDWYLSAKEISNKIRAFNPYPGTFTNGPNGLVKIVTANAIDKKHNFKPGTVVDTNKKITIACGKQSMLEIKELQKPGKNIISSLAFLNGTHISIGEKFGNGE